MTMYLTRIRLNPRRADTVRALRNPQILHATVLAGMPTQPIAASADGRILWRLDDDNAFQPLLFVLSPELPDMTHAVEQFGWPHADEAPQAESRDLQPVLDATVDGAEFSFRLTANPVHTGRTADGTAKTFGHVTAAQQGQWLLQKATRNGFAIVDNEIGVPSLELRNRQRTVFKRGQHKVTLLRVTYEGRLRVTDQDDFHRALTHGIGRGKAYGCGLITLAP